MGRSVARKGRQGKEVKEEVLDTTKKIERRGFDRVVTNYLECPKAHQEATGRGGQEE